MIAQTFKPMSADWIVCFGGEDWWYHSHAHFDIQVMKRLAQRCPVLYICSIGMRMPSLRRDAQFWRRIRNKLGSVSHLLRRVQDRLYVYSPLPIPFYQSSLGRSSNHALLSAQLRFVFQHLGIRRPLYWVNTPTGWPVVRGMGRRGVVYQRTDEYAEINFDNFDHKYVRSLDEELVCSADLVLHVDPGLHARASNMTQSALLFEQGVDERFFDAHASVARPVDMPQWPGLVIGYVGTMERHKFDADLVSSTARLLPECCFVIVGPYHQNAEALRSLPNVRFIGARPHEQIMDYVRSFDICMLPTARTAWGLRCKPIKLMEYLAAGRPVVATRTPAAEQFADLVDLGDTPDAWVAAIHRIATAGRNSQRAEAVRERLSRCSWNRHVERIWNEMDTRGLLGSAGKCPRPSVERGCQESLT